MRWETESITTCSANLGWAAIHVRLKQQRGNAVRAKWGKDLSIFLMNALCLVGCGNFDRAKQRELNSLLRDQNPAHRIAEFKRRSFGEQIDLHLYAMKSKPPISLAEYLAADGEAVIPTIMNRLGTESDEANQMALFEALETMSIVVPSIRTNKELLELVRRKTSEMKDTYLRELSEKSLKMLTNPPDE